MSRYSPSIDPRYDQTLMLSDSDLEQAAQFVDHTLWNRGIDPATVPLPNTHLSTISLYYALHVAAVRAMATGQDTQFTEKARFYRQLYLDEVTTLNSAGLGIVVEPPVTGYGLFSVAVERD